MSRIGKKPINVPEEVEIKIDKDNIIVKGKLGELSQKFDSTSVKLSMGDNRLTVIPVSDSNENRAKYGLYRSLINNMVNRCKQWLQQNLKNGWCGF